MGAGGGGWEMMRNSDTTSRTKDIEKKIHQNFKLLNLCGNPQLISPLAAFVFVPSAFREKFPTAEFVLSFKKSGIESRWEIKDLAMTFM